MTSCDEIVQGRYQGFVELSIPDDEIKLVYDEGYGSENGILNNQYVIVKDTTWGEEIDVLKCKNGTLQKVGFRSIDSKSLGKVRPRNIQQRLAIDMLYDEDTTIKVITGRFGSGKDLLMCSSAVDLIDHGKFEKIVFVRNNIEVKDSKPIGFLPGDYADKMLPFAMPLVDHLGGIKQYEQYISKGTVEVVHLGFIRGRDIKNSIILCTEAENMTKEHIQLLIGRVGEGSSLWINGDFKQCDAEIFRRNSGLMTVVDRLKGHNRFGYVELVKTERSETAAMADLLD